MPAYRAATVGALDRFRLPCLFAESTHYLTLADHACVARAAPIGIRPFPTLHFLYEPLWISVPMVL
jgi:hypothetical protein